MYSSQDAFPFSGRRALVVGGSGGIGAELSLALAARGASVAIHGGNSQKRLEATLLAARAGSRKSGAEVTGFLQPIESPSDLLDRLPGLGRFDILVVAFGPFVQKPLRETSTADWDKLARLDLALPGALASTLLPGMLERGWGRMLFFGGTRTDGIRAYASNAAYAAAKTGLAVLVKSLATEGAGRGLGAFLLCPGFVETEYLSETGKEGLRARAPGGRLIPAREIAGFAASLLEQEPPIASGALISLDAGLAP